MMLKVSYFSSRFIKGYFLKLNLDRTCKVAKKAGIYVNTVDWFAAASTAIRNDPDVNLQIISTEPADIDDIFESETVEMKAPSLVDSGRKRKSTDKM